MVSFDCNPIGFVAFSFIIGILFFIITLAVTLLVTYKFCVVKDKSIENVLKYLCIASEILCTIAVGPGFFLINFWKQECDEGGQLSIGYYISSITVFNTYPVALTFLYAIFAYRIYFTFSRSSMYRLSIKHKWLLIGTFILMAIINVCGIIASFFNLQIALVFLNLGFIVSLISSLVLLFVFYQKMKNLTKLVSNKHTLTSVASKSNITSTITSTSAAQSSTGATGAAGGATSGAASGTTNGLNTQVADPVIPTSPSSDDNLTDKHEDARTNKLTLSSSSTSSCSMSGGTSSQFNPRQVKLINVTGKLALLVFISLITTLLAFFINVFNAILDRPYYFGTIAILSCGLDITTNAVCLMFHWPFAKEYYHKICLPCHKIMINRCSKKFGSYMARRQSNADEFDVY